MCRTDKTRIERISSKVVRWQARSARKGSSHVDTGGKKIEIQKPFTCMEMLVIFFMSDFLLLPRQVLAITLG